MSVSARSSTAAGALCLVLAAALFSLASVLTKLLGQAGAVPAVQIVFARYLLGFLAVGAWAWIGRHPVRPRRLDYVAVRTALNIAGVLLLYAGVQATTVTKANLLNMTYPVFVFALAPWINRERNRAGSLLFIGLALVGMYLVILPRFSGVAGGDLLSLGSAVAMGASIPVLRESRRHDSSLSIMFTMTLAGCLVTFLLSLPRFVVPTGTVLLRLLLSAAAGAAGQVLVTVGYRHVQAVTGSLLESSRIVFAGLLGVLLFAEALTPRLLVGALLILAALLGVSGALRPRQAGPPAGAH